MRVIAVLGSWLGETAGAGERVVEVEDGTTIGQLLRLLAERYGGALKNVIPETGEHPGILVLRNNQVTLDMSERLTDGDTISFTIPLSGG